MAIPRFTGEIGFNAQHSPMGAFFSFTCGHFGTRGGIAAELGRPANQDIYIGVKEGDRYSPKALKCLPFYQGAGSNAAANFLGEQAFAGGTTPADNNPTTGLVAYEKANIRREYGWATDRWGTEDFEFAVFTPFDAIPEPGTCDSTTMRERLIPAVVAELTVDNRAGKETKTGFFALGFHEPGVRILDGGLGEESAGFAFRSSLGVAGRVVDAESGAAQKAFVFMRWSPNDGLANRDNPVHLLGSCPGIGFEVPAGKRYTLRIAMGCYLDGIVTTRIEGRYFYTRCFANLTDVLNTAMGSFQSTKAEAAALDEQLLGSGVSASQQFLIAHATRSYYGSTQLLEVGGEPFWIVNEGEYCMLNTLDLSVDHVFWELERNPWVVRNLLENFVGHYSYHDQVKDPKSGELHPGGISFCHDMGVNNNFSPKGRSSYEIANLPGCFSYMTQEQLCNWILMAGSYVTRTGDGEWLRANLPVIAACGVSMLNRDHPNNDSRNGIMGFDSSRCGSGQEITTYDSLDHSLAQSRNNLYLAVKCWASYLGLAKLFGMAGDLDESNEWVEAAHRAATTIAGQMNREGWIPAVFEPENPGYASRILPAIEGLVYPLYWGYFSTLLKSDGPFGGFLEALKRHTLTLLGDREGRNGFRDGGLRLSSTSNNSWVSKIALFQHVAREVFGLDGDPSIGELLRKADLAHVRWETEGKSAYWAMSDQMVNGVVIGSKYYPRCITTALWMKR